MISDKKIRKVVIVGGGTAGWMSAALIKKILGTAVDIELVESEQIGIIGVGEATIPPIQNVNNVLGLNEAEFLRETKATFKLAIRFENWRQQGHSYYHTFGDAGRQQAFCSFQHYWLRGQQAGDRRSLWDYDLNYLCCKQGVFAKLETQDPFYALPYAYHFDSALYGQYLRKMSERWGVLRTEGMVEHVDVDSDSGFITSLRLKDGRKVQGDLFLDCSGMRGLLIQGELNTGFDDWSHWLPCDRAFAVPTDCLPKTNPFTKAIARQAGWQWNIPLTHRNGNGYVFSSAFLDEDEAAATLLANLDSKPLDDPKLIRFKTGRTTQQWNRNVIAVGLSSGFLEPLESTSIHLVQSAVVRLLKLFPHHGISDTQINQYNKESKFEYETIRDFIILHYKLNEREDTPFWREMQSMYVPARLSDKMALFRDSGVIFQDELDIFRESSWLQVMLGQGIQPRDYHPIAGLLSDKDLLAALDDIAKSKQNAAEKIPNHDDFIQRFSGRSN